ncbi:hypothetical protein D3C72_665290 [compost metagenome]
MELVAARLGNRVDHAAGEGAVLDAEGSDVDADGLNDRARDRRTQGRIAVTVQTEVVALTDAVDQDGVIAGVLAADGQGVIVRRVDRGERRRADDVFDVAADRGKRVDVFLIQAGGRRRAHCTRATHDDIGDLRRALILAPSNGQIEGGRRTDADRRQGRGLLASGRRHLDQVGAAHAQVAGAIAAVNARYRGDARARRNVGDDHRGIGDGRACTIRNHAADTAGRFLCEGGAGRRQQNRSGGRAVGEVSVEHVRVHPDLAIGQQGAHDHVIK